MKFTIGCDPEFFLKKGDKYVNGLPYFYGMKGDPQPIGNGAGAMIDNAAVEFCTPPFDKEAKWTKGIKRALQSMQKLLPDDVELVIAPAVEFEQSELENPICKEFGCSPDYNAWKGGKKNKKPKDAAKKPLRSAGGHIHVGHESLAKNDDKITFIKLMDAIHGVVSTIFDDNQERRKLYGAPGCFRPTKYGVEYRTLSNFWCKSSDLVRLMYKLTRDALKLHVKGKANEIIAKIGDYEIQRIISEGDKEAALSVLAEHIIPNISGDSANMIMDCAGKQFNDKWYN